MEAEEAMNRLETSDEDSTNSVKLQANKPLVNVNFMQPLPRNKLQKRY